MSLINEALKRAKQAPLRPPVAASELALQPAVYAPRTRLAPAWMVLALAMMALLLASWFLAQWWQRSHGTMPLTALQPAIRRIPPPIAPSAPAPAPAYPSAPAPAAPAKTTPSPAAAVTPVALAAASRPAPAASVPVAHAPAVPNPAPAAVEPPAQSALPAPSSPTPQSAPIPKAAAAPEQPAVMAQPLPIDSSLGNLKVQGIFYRLTQASVLINGQTLFVGDEIDGAKVVAIERQSVHMLSHGKTNVLKLR